jgi:hypothetical protein
MTHPSDDEIRARFQGLKRDVEQGGVPDFREMVARARAEAPPDAAPERRRWLIAGGWAGAAAAAAVAGVLLTRGPSAEDLEFERMVAAYAAWSSPTDALLEVPGNEMLSSVPSLGGLPGLALPALPAVPDLDGPGDSL